MSHQSAEIIKSFLSENNISKRQFAIQAGISRFSVYRYLAGQSVQPKAAKRMEANILENLRVYLPHEKLLK